MIQFYSCSFMLCTFVFTLPHCVLRLHHPIWRCAHHMLVVCITVCAPLGRLDPLRFSIAMYIAQLLGAFYLRLWFDTQRAHRPSSAFVGFYDFFTSNPWVSMPCAPSGFFTVSCQLSPQPRRPWLRLQSRRPRHVHGTSSST